MTIKEKLKIFNFYLKGTPYRGAGRVIADARETARFYDMENYSLWMSFVAHLAYIFNITPQDFRWNH
jgi:hypothetical protein